MNDDLQRKIGKIYDPEEGSIVNVTYSGPMISKLDDALESVLNDYGYYRGESGYNFVDSVRDIRFRSHEYMRAKKNERKDL